jgi:signal recognition particle subunit SRP54
MGPLTQLLELMPKTGPLKGLDPTQIDEKELVKVEAIINSMTPQERRHPQVLTASRKRRIQRGSGTSAQDLNRLLKQYKGMRKMFKGVRGSWLRKALGGM